MLLGILNSQAAGGGAGAYDLLETTTLGSSASSVTFSGLGSYSDYAHLQIRAVARGDAGSSYGWQWLEMKPNSTNVARFHEIRGMGGSVTSGVDTNNFTFPITGADQDANNFGTGVIDILDFLNTSKNTTIRSLGGSTDADRPVVVFSSSLYNATTAVTTLEFTCQNGGNLVSGSRFSLYGIKGA